MTTATYLKHAAEIYSSEGPTGRFAEVTRVDVRDYGGNVLFSGTADECVAAKFRVPTRLIPTEWTPFAGDVAGADHSWACVIAE